LQNAQTASRFQPVQLELSKASLDCVVARDNDEIAQRWLNLWEMALNDITKAPTQKISVVGFPSFFGSDEGDHKVRQLRILERT
jgi:hypothetical protein